MANTIGFWIMVLDGVIFTDMTISACIKADVFGSYTFIGFNKIANQLIITLRYSPGIWPKRHPILIKHHSGFTDIDNRLFAGSDINYPVFILVSNFFFFVN